MKPQRGTSQHKAQFMILTFHIRAASVKRTPKTHQHPREEHQTHSLRYMMFSHHRFLYQQKSFY